MIYLQTTLAGFLFLLGLGCKEGVSNIDSKEDLNDKGSEKSGLYMDKYGVKKWGADGEPFLLDPIRGEIYWRVMMCTHPKCSGRTPSQTHLFILPDQSVSVSEGAILYADSFDNLENQSDNEVQVEGLCPKCETDLQQIIATRVKSDGVKVSEFIRIEKMKLKQFVKPYYKEAKGSPDDSPEGK